jgi:hypothetical protein
MHDVRPLNANHAFHVVDLEIERQPLEVRAFAAVTVDLQSKFRSAAPGAFEC